MSQPDEPTAPLPPEQERPTTPLPAQHPDGPSVPAQPTRPWHPGARPAPTPPAWQPSPPVPSYTHGPRPGEPPVYPPPPYTPYAPPRPPAKDNTGKILLITFGCIVGGALLLCLVFGVFGVIGDRAARSNLTVTPTKCEEAMGIATVEFDVINNGTTEQDARVEIEYRDSDGTRLDTDRAYVRDIPGGDRAGGSDSTILDKEPTGTMTCKVRIG